jgi:hypothetical protein
MILTSAANHTAADHPPNRIITMATPRKRQPPAPVRVIKAAEQTAEQAAEQTAPAVVASQPPAASLPDAVTPPAPPAPASGKLAGFAFTFVKKSGRTAGSVNGAAAEIERPEWSADLRKAADLIGFRLPDFYPAQRDRKDGRKAPWRLCAMPKLEALYQPIPPRGSADRDTSALVEGVLYGFDGMFPSMVDGKGMPLIDILNLFAHPTVWDTYLKVRALHSLTPYSINGRDPQHTTCLLHRLAERSNRYCYCEDAILYLSDKADS